jgi:hypothetical protein
MKFLLPLALLAASAFAQQQPQTPPPAQQNDAVTVVGCLTKGATDTSYVVTDQKSGEKYNFTASQQLDSYLNHTVQLTGTMTQNGGDKAFQPQKIRTVSNSCEQQ